MKRSAKHGFTLVEILIVVIILGILAAIVIPQFTSASSEARISNLLTNLQTVRGQLMLYKTQHNETYPDTNLVTQITRYTDVSGGTSTTPDTTHVFGPYVVRFPVNPISGVATVRFETDPATAFSAPAADGGWYYNTALGEFRADLKDSWVTSDGTKCNAM